MNKLSKKPIHVLWICYYPPSRVGAVREMLRPGSEHPAPWLVTTAEAVKKYCPEIDLEIAFVHPRITQDWSGEQGDIGFHALKVNRTLPLLKKNWPPFLYQVLTRFKTARLKLGRIIQNVQPDIIHAFGTEGAFALAAMESGLPFLVSMQGLMEELAEANPRDIYFKFRVPLEQCAMKCTLHVIAPSGHAERFVQKRYPDCECRLIENPVPASFFSVPDLEDPQKRILFVGRIAKAKGIEELLTACAEHADWRLSIVGAGEPEYVERLKKKYCGAKHFRWLGPKPSAEIPGLLAKTDLFVLPSYMESAGLVVQEAMAAGRPVVASRAGGIVDFVDHGVSGLLVPPKQVDSLEDAILTMLNDPGKMIKAGQAAREAARRRFQMEPAAKQTVEFYKDILAKEC